MMNLDEIQPQKIFDAACIHILGQNSRAFSSGRCMYKTPEGLLCPIGIFLTVEQLKYADEHEKTAYEMLDCINQTKHKRLLGEIQEIHDLEDVISWPEHLINLAESFGLSDYWASDYVTLNKLQADKLYYSNFFASSRKANKNVIVFSDESKKWVAAHDLILISHEEWANSAAKFRLRTLNEANQHV